MFSYNETPGQQAIRANVEAFARKEIDPVSDYWDRMPEPRKFPGELYGKLADAGYLGYTLPTEYGGRNGSAVEFATLIEQLCYHDAAFGLLCGIARLIAYPILQFGNDYLRSKYLADIVSGKCIPAFALSEPDAGSDAASLKTTAVDTGNEYLINGTKMFITHGDVADLVLLFCRIEGSKKISAILVETNQPGWQPTLLKNKMGVRASTTASIEITDVKAPRENLLGEVDQGFRYAMQTLDGARVTVASQALGIARRALDESVTYSKKRIAFGAPIAKLQAIQWMIADMATRLKAAQIMSCHAAEKQDRGERFSMEAAQAKLYAAETANFCVDRAMQIHGGYGYIGEFSIIEKLYRDQRFLEIGEGTSEILRMVIAGNILNN